MLVAINVLFSLFVWLLWVKPDVLSNLTTIPMSTVWQVTTLGEVVLLFVIFMAVTVAMMIFDKLVISRKRAHAPR